MPSAPWRSQERRDRREGRRQDALFQAGDRAPGLGDLLGRRAEALVELSRELFRPELQIELQGPFQAPRVEVAGSEEQLLSVADEHLRVQHLRVVEDAHARVEQALVVEPLGGRAGPVAWWPSEQVLGAGPRRRRRAGGSAHDGRGWRRSRWRAHPEDPRPARVRITSPGQDDRRRARKPAAASVATTVRTTLTALRPRS